MNDIATIETSSLVRKKAIAESASIDLYECSKDLMSSEVHIRGFFRELLKIISVEPYGACHIVHHGKSEEDFGYSAFQLLNAFSVSAHFIEKDQRAHIHIFLDKPIKSEDLALFSKEFFEAKKYQLHKNIRS